MIGKTNSSSSSVDWAGELTFTFQSSSYNSATYFTEAGCSLAVDPIRGMAFVTIQGGTSTAYENIYFSSCTVPTGVTILPSQGAYTHSSNTAQRYYTQAFSGITGKINVNAHLYTVNSSYDYVNVQLTLTYV